MFREMFGRGSGINNNSISGCQKSCRFLSDPFFFFIIDQLLTDKVVWVLLIISLTVGIKDSDSGYIMDYIMFPCLLYTSRCV